MTTVSAPTPRALGRERSRRFGPMLGAVAIVLAAGAAIGIGFAVTGGETVTSVDQSHSVAEAARMSALQGTVDQSHNVAEASRMSALQGTVDQSHNVAEAARMSALQGTVDQSNNVAEASRMSALQPQTGTQSPDLSTYEGLVAAGIIPEAFQPTTDLSTYEGLVAAGIIPEAFQPAPNPTLEHFQSINVIPEYEPAPFVEKPGQPR